MSITDLFSNPGYFFAGKPNPNVPQDLRQKLALAMLAQKRKYPQNFGEGLSAIGEAIGQSGMMDRIMGEAAEAELAGQKARKDYEANPVPPAVQPQVLPPQAAAPQPLAQTAAAAAKTNQLYNDPRQPTDQTPVPGDQPEGGPSRGVVFRPQISAPAPTVPARPAVAVPPGQAADDEAKGLTRLSSDEELADFRAQNPLPGGIPPVPRGLTPAAAAPPTGGISVANYGQKPVLARTQVASAAPMPFAPPVVASDPASLTPEAQQQRREIGASLLRQQMGGGGATRGAALTPPAAAPAAVPPPQAAVRPPQDTSQGIRPAPPAAPQMAQAPQAGPVPGYVLKPPADPERPPITTPGMQQLQKMIDDAPASVRESVRAGLANPIAREQAKLAQEQKIYDDKMRQVHEFRTKAEDQKASQQQRIDEHRVQTAAATKAERENEIRAQFGGMEPAVVHKSMDESAKVAQSAAKGLVASQSAIQALDSGAITGAGANAKLNAAKVLHAMGLPDKGNIIANTETFRGAMQPVVSSILHQTSGVSQLSEGELKFANAAAAGDISLDEKSIRQLTTIIDKGARGIIEDHQKKLSVLFGDSPQAKAMYGAEAPKPLPSIPTFANDAEVAAARLERGTRVRVNGRMGTVN